MGRLSLFLLIYRIETIFRGIMQTTLLDYMDAASLDRQLAKIKLILKTIHNANIKIKKVNICKCCKKLGYLHYCLVSDNTRNYYKFFIINNLGIKFLNRPIEFIGNYCKHCYNSIIKNTINDIINDIIKLIIKLDLPVPPYVSYLTSKGFAIKLPSGKYIYENTTALKNIILQKVINIIRYVNQDCLNKEEVIRKLETFLKRGTRDALEIAVFARVLKGITSKKLQKFLDVIGLVAYVEGNEVINLMSDYRRYGFIFSRDQKICFAERIISGFSPFQIIQAKVFNGKIIYRGVYWEINPTILKYLRPLSLGMNKDKILQIRTRHCFIYIAPSSIKRK